MLFIGIDPGLRGAVSVLDHNGLRAVFDLPVMQDPIAGPNAKIQRKIDSHTLAALLLNACPASEGKPTAVIEAVATMGDKNNSVQSQGSLLRTLGALEAVLECLGWAPTYVRPQAWKKFYGLIDPDQTDTQRKRSSLEMARRLYPDCTDIPLALHHNRAESILLGHYGKRTMA